MIEGQIVAFMRDRLERLGEAESGLYDYYSARLTRPDPYNPAERRILAHVQQSDARHVTHVGGGIGMLSALLARGGKAVRIIEQDRRRHACAVALRDALGLSYDVVCAGFPDGIGTERDMLLLTNLAAPWGDETEQAIIDAFSLFRAVVVMPRRFGAHRDDPESIATLVARFPGVSTSVTGTPYVEVRP